MPSIKVEEMRQPGPIQQGHWFGLADRDTIGFDNE